MSRSFLIASGKGGVGKSTLTANIGAALALLGKSVVIIDTDIGLRSQDALLGLENSVVYDLIDVSNKDCTLEQALLNCASYPGLSLIPASQFARVKSLDSSRFKKMLNTLKESFDFILIDSPAGIEKGFRNILRAEPDEVILVVTPDEISMRDAERAAQIVEEKQHSRPQLIVNRLDTGLIQEGEMYTARAVADALDFPLLGEIPEDPVVYRSVLRHRLLIDFDCDARGAVLRIAGRLLGDIIPLPEIGRGHVPFFRRLFRKTIKEVTPLDRH